MSLMTVSRQTTTMPQVMYGITNIPLDGLQGKVFRGTMPHGLNKREGRVGLVNQLSSHGINVIVLLCNQRECERSAGIDLADFYGRMKQIKLEVIELAIPDFGTPKEEDLARVVKDVHERALSGLNILVHCQGGMGRTGMVLACLLRQVYHYNGEVAIRTLREYVPGAVETRDQVKMVDNFAIDQTITPLPVPAADDFILVEHPTKEHKEAEDQLLPVPQLQPKAQVVVADNEAVPQPQLTPLQSTMSTARQIWKNLW